MSEFRLAVGIENRKRFTKSGDNPSENMSCQDIKEIGSDRCSEVKSQLIIVLLSDRFIAYEIYTHKGLSN